MERRRSSRNRRQARNAIAQGDRNYVPRQTRADRRHESQSYVNAVRSEDDEDSGYEPGFTENERAGDEYDQEAAQNTDGGHESTGYGQGNSTFNDEDPIYFVNEDESEELHTPTIFVSGRPLVEIEVRRIGNEISRIENEARRIENPVRLAENWATFTENSSSTSSQQTALKRGVKRKASPPPEPSVCKRPHRDVSCPVCRTSLLGVSVVSTACGHLTCRACMQVIMRGENYVKKCPSCRAHIRRYSLRSIYF